MKNHFKGIISSLFILVVINSFAQEKSFYIRSIRSIHLENERDVLQEIKFKDVDVLYNKTCQFLNETITVNTSGVYSISAFANINPGVMGSSEKDSISMEMYLYNNKGTSSEQVVGKTNFVFTYGNFDVAAGLQILPIETTISKGDALSLWIKILSSSNIDINKSKKYDHITKPTGMEQIAGIYLSKISE